MVESRGTIGILTSGGDVPGLNPAIRAITIRAIGEGYRVIGINRGWAGLVEMVRDLEAPHDRHWQVLNEETVNQAGRTGGTFLHTSRTSPLAVAADEVPEHLKATYNQPVNDMIGEVIANLQFLKIDTLIAIGGDVTVRVAHRLNSDGVKVIVIPKTVDNNVAGTDYCIGFSTCVTRTIEHTHRLRTSAGSHERFAIIEVFGQTAGFAALLAAMAGAANRCVIPEYPFDVGRLCELLSLDRRKAASNYSLVLVSEGAWFANEARPPNDDRAGVGDIIAARLKEISPDYNGGKRVNVISQRLGYLVRCGDPDAIDSIVPMAYGNLAFDLILEGTGGRLVALRRGVYDHVPLDVAVGREKVVDVAKFYNTDRLRPFYKKFYRMPLLIMTGEF